MKIETARMIEEKERFAREIGTLLSMDPRSEVDCVEYKLVIQDEKGEFYDEYIDIIYRSGSVRRLLTTGNSNGANLKEIAKEVY